MPLGDLTTTEEGIAFLRKWKKLTFHQSTLYHQHTPAGELEEMMCVMVPKTQYGIHDS